MEKHPNLQVTEVAKKLSEKWKSLSEERKEKYKLKYQNEKEQYLQDLEKFYEDHPDARPAPIKPKYYCVLQYMLWFLCLIFKFRPKPKKRERGKQSKPVQSKIQDSEDEADEISRKRRIKEVF